MTQNPIGRRPPLDLPVFGIGDDGALLVFSGTAVNGVEFTTNMPIDLPNLETGKDYLIQMVDGRLSAVDCIDAPPADAIGGFHYSPGGNASARSGGDSAPAINPFSIWDAGFRPSCADPRGMALVKRDGRSFWCDIYLLGINHLAKGTSRHGEIIADGYKSKPLKADNKSEDKLDYKTAVAIYASHGKKLLGAEQFFAAAYGVTERSSATDKPDTAGLDAARTSQAGIMQATGNLWVWGTDGDPDDPSPSVFGGSWIDGDSAGSRYAYLDNWPADSNDALSARGCCDHLMLE